MPIVSGGGAGSLPSGGASGQVVAYGGSSGVGTWVYPPGREIGYDQITSSVNLTGTTEGTATTIITCAAHTFDGAAVLVEFQAVTVTIDTNASGDNTIIGLFESGTLINRFAYGSTSGQGSNKGTFPGAGFMRITPSAGSHSYVVAGWVSNTAGTPGVIAGAGGAGANPPAFVRFTKV